MFRNSGLCGKLLLFRSPGLSEEIDNVVFVSPLDCRSPLVNFEYLSELLGSKKSLNLEDELAFLSF